ncbi:hypothetical protein B005_4268 [Nocardiopsis alba ATCC BAA-2165]|uniref:Uncharacterized protein n=1 Tax=Nocardiopsis alba (strain ATCC BAA-2165 / BE74) TaxID=1205910 RepID=J7LIG0_NOCAA|nr:hypothetical protein B005_4268 [Nocardiopsis alba ATCC BAA-2165]
MSRPVTFTPGTSIAPTPKRDDRKGDLTCWSPERIFRGHPLQRRPEEPR